MEGEGDTPRPGGRLRAWLGEHRLVVLVAIAGVAAVASLTRMGARVAVSPAAAPARGEEASSDALDGGAAPHVAARALAEAAALPEPPPPRLIQDEGDDEGDGESDEAREGSSDTLTRADVLAALQPFEQRVASCYGPQGRGTVKLTITSSGRVIGAKVAGPLAATPAGDCVEEVARQAVFRGTRREITTLHWTLPMHVGGSGAP